MRPNLHLAPDPEWLRHVDGGESANEAPATEQHVLSLLHLVGSRDQRPRKLVANLMTIFGRDTRWHDVLAYDGFAEHPVILCQPPQREQDWVPVLPGSPWSSQDSTRAAAWFFEKYRLDMSQGSVTEAMLAVSQRRIVHPVRDYLNSLAWDQTRRLDTFFPAYCGAPDCAYAHGVARILFLSAVARVYRPGCKVDTIVILEGPQGTHKSTLLAALAGEKWFADTPLALGDKDAYQALRGVWIYELAELVALKGRDATRIKSFASSPTDHYRPSYEPRARSVPRQCIFVGTTNEAHYLADATGARRFWPLRVNRADVEAVRRDRDQLWAEARCRFESGEQWWPTHELDSLGADAQDDRFEGDPWEERILKWLARPTRVVVDVQHERHEERLEPDEGLAMSAVLEHAVHVPVERQDKAAQGRAAQILRRAGWERGPMRREHGERVRRWFKAPPCHQPNSGDTGVDEGR